MSPEEFRVRVLGRLSPHPYWRAKRSTWLRWIAVLPLVAVLVLLAMTLSDVFRWGETLGNLPQWVILGAGAFAFGTGFLMTWLLIDRWAYLQGRGDEVARWSRRLSALKGFPLDPWILAGALALGLAGPWLLRRYDLLPPYLHLLPELMAFLPLLAILLALRYLEDRRKPMRWRAIWPVLIGLGGALLLLTIAYDLANAWKATELRNLLFGLIGWYAEMERPFLGTVLLVPFLFAMAWIWRFWTEVAPPGEVLEKEAQEHPGLWGKLKDYLARLFGKPQPVPEQTKGLPDWMLALLQSLRQDPRWHEAGSPELVHEPEMFSDQGQASLVEESPFRAYFLGRAPTQAQDRFLNRFNDVYQASLLSPTGLGDGEPLSADLLVEGDIGTGRSSTLVAAAVVAAGVRGQRVLYLTASERQTSTQVRRIREVFSHLGMEMYFACEPITAQHVRHWLSGSANLPNVLVGAPADVERFLYGAPVEGDQAGRIKILLSTLEVLLVDDFTGQMPEQSIQLPFVIDKQVLLLASRHIPAQVVVVMPPLAPMARNLVTDRLFRHLTPEKNNFVFQPPPAPSGYRVSLWSDDPQGTFEVMQRWLEESGKAPVALRSCAEIGATDVRSDAVLLLAGTLGGDEGRAGLLSHGKDGCLVVRVLPRGETAQQQAAGVVPVIVGRSARPVLLTHLRSLTRFLEPGVPIPLVYWKQFGLDAGPGKWGYPAMPSDPGLLVEARFRIDAVPPSLRDHIGQGIWPYLMLEEESTYHRVGPDRLPDQRRQLYEARQNGGLLLAVPEQVTEVEDRRAIWRFRDGDRESDLGYPRPLLVEREAVRFVPGRLEQDPATGQIHIEPRQVPEGGRAFSMPLLEVRWEIDSNLIARSAMVKEGAGYKLHDFEGDAPCAARVVWRGLLDEFGRATQIAPPVGCHVTSSLTGLLLLPQPMKADTLFQDLPRLLAGHWETGQGETGPADRNYRFWPAMTAAFNYAMRRWLPGAGTLAQAMAFGLTGTAATAAKAVVWILEPENTGDTVRRVLRALLEDDAERKVFFESMAWFLGQLQSRQASDNAQRISFMRRFAGLGYAGDSDLEPLAEPMAVCRELVARTDPSATIEEPLPVEPPL